MQIDLHWTKYHRVGVVCGVMFDCEDTALNAKGNSRSQAISEG